MKQAIVVRNELKMPKGKLAAQVAHASLEAALKTDPRKVEEWRQTGAKKVVLKVASLRELKQIFRKAESLELPVAMISDAGRTFFSKTTVTCCGIGPAKEGEIDEVTKSLTLL